MNVESPVRIPSQIHEDAFFYDERNRGVLNSVSDYAFFVPYSKRNDTALGAFIIVLGALTLCMAFASIWIAILPFLGLMTVIATNMYEPERKRKQLSARFLQEGEVLLGEIVTCVASMDGYGNYRIFQVETQYRYQLPNGDFVDSSINEPRPDLNGTQLPPLGTPVYVLYFNEQEAYLL